MRKDSTELTKLKLKSLRNPGEEFTFTNKFGEIFVYCDGELITFTDTRVIEHETDRLVNLFENPINFDDSSLPEMDMASNV